MDVQHLRRDDLRQILRVSDGIPKQRGLAKIVSGRVKPKDVGHPISKHIHSVGWIDRKNSKFRSMDDMVEALWQTLRSPANTEALRSLNVGDRRDFTTEMDRLLSVECDMYDVGSRKEFVVTFSPEEQRRTGRTTTVCVAVLEVRERAGVPKLQVHSIYPKLTVEERWLILQFARMAQR